MTTITFTPEAVKAVLLGAGFTAFSWDNIDKPGFKIAFGGEGQEIVVWVKGAGVSDFPPGEGPKALVGDYLRALDQAGYVVREAGDEVRVSGVEG